MGHEICPASPLFSSGDDLFAMTEDEAIENTGESITGDNTPGIESTIPGIVSFVKPDGNDFGKEATGSKRNVLDFDLTSPDKVNGQVIVEARQNNEDIDFDLSSFSMDTKESNEAEKDAIDLSAQADAFPGEQVEDVKFDLSLLPLKSDEADQGVVASNAITGKFLGATDEDIDFDLSSFSIESDNGVVAPNTQTGKSSKARIEDFDFSPFSMDANESDKADQNLIDSNALLSSPPETSVGNKQQEYEAHEFDFSFDNAETKEVDSLDFSATNNDVSSGNSLNFNDDMGGDFDFNFDLDLLSTTKDQEFGQHEEFGVSALTDMDELETKLDLAKAYVDMGDADAAKDLASEVLEQGTVEQKNTAQALLDELG
jgi:pilus assembly protein FimV